MLASHSHFLMSDVYKTSCHRQDEVLPGWIVGTAGAIRYRLPRDHATAAVAETDVYGYLLGTVTPEGHVSFVFNQIKMDDISEEIRARFGTDLVNRCFVEKKSDYVPEGASCESK